MNAIKKDRKYNLFKRLSFQLVAIVMSILTVGCFLEIFLRFTPIKGIKMSSRTFDPDLLLYKFVPGSRFVRVNIQNERIIRIANSDGFLDVNHNKNKRDNVYRIGFFGDSYVESIQVPLKETFFRIIQKKVAASNIEIFAFGLSGHGTLHGYLLSRKYTDLYDLDLVVYAFYENDPGDQVERFKKAESLPYVKLDNKNDILIDNYSLSRYVVKRKYDNAIKKFSFFNNSILLQTIYNRIQLLRHHGVKMTVTKEDMNMSSINTDDEIPTGSDLPSTWPRKYYQEATKKCEAVILKWSKEIEAKERNFSVFYIPRKSEWKKNDKDQDSWKYWLKNFSNKNGIDFIDPTEFFFKYSNEGKIIYTDHFTRAGHMAFADSFLSWFNNDREVKNH